MPRPKISEKFWFVDRAGLAHRIVLNGGPSTIRCSGASLEEVVGDHGPRHERGLKSADCLDDLMRQGKAAICPACDGS